MKDIIVLIVIPVVFLSICIIVAVKKTNRIAGSNKLSHRIITISKRPRVIRDNNHKLTHMNKLMTPEREQDFDADIINLIRNSFGVSSRTTL